MDRNVTKQHPAIRSRLSGAMEVQTILHSGEASDQSATARTDHGSIHTSPIKTMSRSSSMSSRSSHMRSYSIADPVRQSKRLSLTLPVQTDVANASYRTTPSPSKSTFPTTIPEDLASPTGPTDSSFLTALAAQERRVLELREELLRAEQALKKLKSDWSAHEAQKKRHDEKRVIMSTNEQARRITYE